MTERRHARLIAGAIAVPVLALFVLVPGVASAKTSVPKPVKGQCAHLTGNAAVSSGPGSPMLSTCSPAPNATGTAPFTFVPGASTGSSTVNWPNGAKLHFSFTVKQTLPTKGKKVHGVTENVPNPKYHCGDPNGFEIALKGKIAKVGGNTNLPAGDSGLKGSVKADICVSSSLDLRLDTGTVFAL